MTGVDLSIIIGFILAGVVLGVFIAKALVDSLREQVQRALAAQDKLTDTIVRDIHMLHLQIQGIKQEQAKTGKVVPFKPRPL